MASFPTDLHGHCVTSGCSEAGNLGFLEKLPKTFLEVPLLGLIPKPSSGLPKSLLLHIPISPYLQIPDLDLGIHRSRPKNEPIRVELGTGES